MNAHEENEFLSHSNFILKKSSYKVVQLLLKSSCLHFIKKKSNQRVFDYIFLKNSWRVVNYNLKVVDPSLVVRRCAL
jgi:hypothetical protein